MTKRLKQDQINSSMRIIHRMFDGKSKPTIWSALVGVVPPSPKGHITNRFMFFTIDRGEVVCFNHYVAVILGLRRDRHGNVLDRSSVQEVVEALRDKLGIPFNLIRL